MANRLWATAHIGGTEGALDNIDPTDIKGNSTFITLEVGDVCEVIDGTSTPHLYVARNSAGAVELLPNVVVPDNNAGDWWWEKMSDGSATTTGMVDALLYANIPGGF